MGVEPRHLLLNNFVLIDRDDRSLSLESLILNLRCRMRQFSARIGCVEFNLRSPFGIGRGRDSGHPLPPRTDPYVRSLAHTALISDA